MPISPVRSSECFIHSEFGWLFQLARYEVTLKSHNRGRSSIFALTATLPSPAKSLVKRSTDHEVAMTILRYRVAPTCSHQQ